MDGHCYGTETMEWSHSWFHCGGRSIARILASSRLPVGRPFAVKDSTLLERYLMETFAEWNGWRGGDEIVLRNLFENFVRAQARQLFDSPEKPVSENLQRIKSHVELHFTENLRLRDLAKKAGWSVPHLCTEFKRHFGVPLIHYILQLRMNQAVYLLRDYNRSVSEIASQVGYADLYTFSKMFKRNFGISPRAFRNGALRGTMEID